MAHIESSAQAVKRLDDAAVRKERTTIKARGDDKRIHLGTFNYLRTVRNTRLQTRYAGGIRSLERGILGTAGSVEQLNKYRELAATLGEQAGQPVVEIEELSASGEHVQKARVGEVGGSLQARASFLNGSFIDITGPQQRASIQMPANYLTRFTLDNGNWRIDPASDNDSCVKIAEILLDESANPSRNPERDYIVDDRMTSGAVLLGGEAILDSNLFDPDLKTILDLSGIFH